MTHPPSLLTLMSHAVTGPQHFQFTVQKSVLHLNQADNVITTCMYALS